LLRSAAILAHDLTVAQSGGDRCQAQAGIYKDDDNSWLKIKNRSYSQAEDRHELLTRTKR
jgi:hypothetical protein